MTRKLPSPAAPRDLGALESDDGDLVVLSFSLRQEGCAALTPAESEVAALVLVGRSNADIARVRGASKRTVANQVASVFRKLGVRSRLELIVHAPLLGTKEP
jgi:DNA-binding CsgD family transcriptional regulator